MKRILVLTVAGLLAFASGGADIDASGAVSNEISVNTSPAQQRRWETVTSAEVNLRWEWEQGASSASLSVAGMYGSFTENFPQGTTGYTLRAFTGESPDREDILRLKLSFFDPDGKVIAAREARLAVLKGAFGGIDVVRTPEGTPWPTLKEFRIIPYDMGWSMETEDVQTPTLEIVRAGTDPVVLEMDHPNGYFDFGPGYGQGLFDFALSTPDMDRRWTGRVFKFFGTLMLLR